MDDARLLLCARCARQVVVCPRCDHGQLYCGRECSGLCRAESRRAAGRRYQRTRAGRHHHAARQRRYRARRRDAGVVGEKVTHHGSRAPAGGAPLRHAPTVMREAPMSKPPAPTSPARCHFCHRPLSDFWRLGPRHQAVRRSPRAPARR